VRVLIGGSTHGLDDARRVVDRLSGVPGRAGKAELFAPDRDVLVVRAPRLVTLGGALGARLGGPSLHWPLGAGVFVVAQSQAAPVLRVARFAPGLDRVAASLELPLSHFTTRAGPVPYGVVRDFVHRHEDRLWAARTLGGLLVLMHERDHRAEEGVTLALVGTGARPSAPELGPAESVALLRALTLVCRLPADAADLASLACASDARMLGAAEPLAAYLAAVRATPGAGLLVDAGPAPRTALLQWPAGLHLTVLEIDTMPGPLPLAAAHVALGAAEVRCAAHLAPAALPGGVLARCTPERFQAEWAHALPEWLPGSEVRATAGAGIWDTPDGPRPEIDDARRYPVRAIARLAVADADRLQTLATLLEGGGPHRDAQLAALCAESWAEHTALGLVPGAVADAVRAARPAFAAAGGLAVLDAAPGAAPRLAVVEHSPDATAATLLAEAVGQAVAGHVARHEGSSPGLLRFGTLRLRAA
jgi:hypothetical protein